MSEGTRAQRSRAGWAPLLLSLFLLLEGCSSPSLTAAAAAGALTELPPDRIQEEANEAEPVPALSPTPVEPPTEAPLACAAIDPRNLQLGRRGELVRGDPVIPQIALTFDAGAGSGTIDELLDVLRDRDVRSTFFVAGAFADRYPRIVERMGSEGHELANHSYSHPDFRNLTDPQMRDELHRGTTAIERAAGVPIAPLWRPPFGGRDDRVLRVVEDEGFRSVYWTFDSGDWIEGTTARQVMTTDLSKAENGAVVVHHVSPEATARAMPSVIDELRRRGFDLVTVSEILGYDGACLPKLE